MTTVSVCIPTFNYGRFLPDAIASVAAQTYADFELIVVDNCSTDDTGSIVANLARTEPRLRYYRNDRNLGICGNFNRALELGAGEYVKILCADDWLAPQALEKSVAALARHPGAALVTTGRLMMSEQRERLGFECYCRTPAVVDGHAAIKRCLFGTNYIGEPSAVLFRRKLALRGFDERYPHLLDMEMWFHLLEQGSLACIPEPLTMMREHALQATRANIDAGRIVADKKRLFAGYGAKPYIAANRWNTLVWRLRTAYNLWSASRGAHRNEGAPAIGEFVSPLLFYCLLPAFLALAGIRNVRRRLRARGEG